MEKIKDCGGIDDHYQVIKNDCFVCMYLTDISLIIWVLVILAILVLTFTGIFFSFNSKMKGHGYFIQGILSLLEAILMFYLIQKLTDCYSIIPWFNFGKSNFFYDHYDLSIFGYNPEPPYNAIELINMTVVDLTAISLYT